LWEKYKQRAEKGDDTKAALDDLEVERYCCRAMFLGQVDLGDIAGQFKKY
jgi:DNA-directed RNA polymerase subunit N (RpoN/RPB10)